MVVGEMRFEGGRFVRLLSSRQGGKYSTMIHPVGAVPGNSDYLPKGEAIGEFAKACGKMMAKYDLDETPR